MYEASDQLRWSSISKVSPSIVQVTQVPGVTSWDSARMSWNGHIGSITSGKRALLLVPSTWSTFDRPPGDALDRVKHDEAGAVGEDIGLRLGHRLEQERAVAPAGDLRVVDELPPRVRAGGAVADGERAGLLVDLQILDRRA